MREADLGILANLANDRADLVGIAEVVVPFATGEKRRLAVGDIGAVARARQLGAHELHEALGFPLFAAPPPVIDKSAHDWVPHRHDRADL